VGGGGQGGKDEGRRNREVGGEGAGGEGED